MDNAYLSLDLPAFGFSCATQIGTSAAMSTSMHRMDSAFQRDGVSRDVEGLFLRLLRGVGTGVAQAAGRRAGRVRRAHGLPAATPLCHSTPENLASSEVSIARLRDGAAAGGGAVGDS
eukprot:CAMPEP_0184103958 /NCGR_PEP_ID=MMETSP0974-20121125/14118_1 /TAXON_ID=483370 /ORGANISM="non described non described, Strain CCMP2097" /LENGTH=117 /DNA_ID=CAMNT_0026406937 /DNA_START=104 /DNA_END=454 /DNA_ORIENTATION=-